MPKVSVCIPTYNSARYLAEAIESVLQQEFTDYELIICDNASTDETPDICRRYDDPRIRTSRFDTLVNQGGNWNRCLSLAGGQYVALLHADDRYFPEFLTQRVKTLDQYPEVGLAFGAVQWIDENGAEISQQSFRDEAFIAPAPEFYKELLFGCVINPASLVVRRRCYEMVGGFNEERLWGIDWEMWLRLSARYGVAYSPLVSAAYRIHSASGTSQGLLTALNGDEDLVVLQNAFREIDARTELAHLAPLRSRAFRRLARRTLEAAGYNCERGNVSGVRRNLRSALRIDPWLISRPTVWALGLSCYLGSWVYPAFQRLRHEWKQLHSVTGQTARTSQTRTRKTGRREIGNLN
jgi:glycosyltransferase involved in cell wall biosynthesis